jgi:S1-C subfamily serine protease
MIDWETAVWPRAEHLQRIFQIKSGSELGTAFALDVENKEYLITALHVVNEAMQISQFEIYRNGTWIPYVVNVVGVDAVSDIAVFALQERLVRGSLHIEIASDGCVAGQEVFILGYPLGIKGPAVGLGFPLPIIKRGIAANFYIGPPSGLFVSASANPGFSGGPVYFVHQETGKATLTAIVIHALGYEVEVKDAADKVIGKVMTDSNIVQCSYIDSTTKLIKANPIGFSLK